MAEEPTGLLDAVGTTDAVAEATATTQRPGRRRTIVWTIVTVVVLALIVGLTYATNRDAGDTDSPSTLPGTTAPGGTSPGRTAPTVPGQSPSSGAPTTTRPTETAVAGSRLTTVTQPPVSTLTMFEASKLPADARYTIAFSPYGYGPSRSGGPALVVHIDESMAANESARSLDLSGRNMLAAVLSSDNPVTVGGSYTGVLTFRPEGNLLAPVITQIEARD